MLLLVVLCWLWGLTSLKQGGTASATFLPSSMDTLFQKISHLFERSREVLGKDQFDTPVDIDKLPPNYHHEENKQRRVGNSTFSRHYEINKMTDNHTGDMMFSEKSVTSIEQKEIDPKEEDNKSMSNEEENSAEPERTTAGLKIFKLGFPQLRPKLTFLIFRLPQHLKNQQMPEAKLVKEEPISDKRHRLLAIRNGLLAAPHPIKKILPVTPNHKVTPRKRHFFFFWKKI
ncbi:dickkopf-like protein 1 [Thamnophis elegans]|uniref:dickkopf-like protein 1 n=1 Tax=Thamnophis elegans TaxID=35005 RepID=UPI0013783BD5|nr:dickkopf-like protein 1 [Thamnophis elegans]